MKKFWLDCEFNGFEGELISMALAGDGGEEWYEVTHTKQKAVDWVEKNVMPVLVKNPITKEEMRNSLFAFISKFDEVLIIADWPDDIKYFCQLLIVGPGVAINTPNLLYFQLNRNLRYKSNVPHNALEDAKALRNANW